ncbi:MAG: DPP IV N-terminal domain-containing protein [Balneolaceae bacterium]
MMTIEFSILAKIDMKNKLLTVTITIFLTVFLSGTGAAQATTDDYQRAQNLRENFSGTVTNTITGEPRWYDEEENVFWYRKTTEGGHQFIRVDAERNEKQPAFNHSRLASSLSRLTGEDYTAEELPFNSFQYKNSEQEIEVTFNDSIFTCTLNRYECSGREDDTERRGPQQWGAWDHDLDPVDRSHSESAVTSPDEQWEAYVQNYNVVVKHVDSDETIRLSQDGSEGNYYSTSSFSWSPDSKKLAAYRVKPGYDRKIHYVESSPENQLQPRHLSRSYLKPGDALDIEEPVLFHVEDEEQINIHRSLFPNAYSQSRIQWWEDSRAFRFEYNERGHQRYRIIEVDAENGEPRILVNEEPETFFSYATSLFRHYTESGDEIIWMSERDGWRHLYLYDAHSGEVKNQITSGEWVVRSVDHVDEENRRIWFQASGMDDDQDPYYIHYFRVNFDGSGLTRFTRANGTHSVTFSADRSYYVDTWSQVDQAPVSELRRTDDQSLVMELEQGDISALTEAGWQAPEQFTAKGRDGETDIYGVIIRPTHFDPEKSYPVIEYIYAGPHSNFVPKRFLPYSQMMSLAELGFIVVQIDGMGTANRSKAFHDVAWQNLKDAGFPDRILWHEAVAETYSWYDNSKVGIYGRSAGGQSSLGALLFHPEHYHVAVSSVGCHDNRMDKIWWNEQWMGWPIGPQYAASSNVDHAHNLEGNVLLIVGELDTNVDPASTYQVADALIKANKDFDFLSIPGAGHGSIGDYEQRKRFDYFVRHLQGSDTPAWNQVGAK